MDRDYKITERGGVFSATINAQAGNILNSVRPENNVGGEWTENRGTATGVDVLTIKVYLL